MAHGLPNMAQPPPDMAGARAPHAAADPPLLPAAPLDVAHAHPLHDARHHLRRAHANHRGALQRRR
eukprot:6807043-Prymnesium_polylepis.3